MPSERKDYDIVGSYDNQRVSTINAERTVNMFEYLDPQGKRPKSMLPTSGLVDTMLPFGAETGGARQTFVFDDAIYQVYGATVYRTTGTTGNLINTVIGTIGTSAGYVGIDANTFQVIFVDGQSGYIWDTNASTFEPITDTGFPAAPVDVCYLDGFFVVAHGGTNEFQLSSFNQGMVWSGATATFTADSATDILTLSISNANFATGVPITFSTTGTLPAPLVAGPPQQYYVIRVGTAATNPGTIRVAATYADAIAGTFIDLTTNGAPTNTVHVVGQVQSGQITSHPGTIVACRTLHRRLFLFSQNFTEVWENAGIGTNLPFRRNNSLLMEVGTPALGSVVVGFDRMFFLAQDKDGLAGVMEVKGTESILVSNRALDYQLAQYAAMGGVDDARGILIKENGLIFYRLNFTAANHTFVLNVSMSTQESPKWHEEEILNGDRHPAQTHAYFDGVNYYGAYDAPLFYRVDDRISTNAGEAIRRMRIGRQISPEGYNRLRIDRFQLDVLQGAAIFLNIISPFTANATSDVLTITDNPDALFWQTGEAVRFDSNGSLPSPLTKNTIYYVIRLSAALPAQIKVAATYADALAGTAINITTAGTGTNTIHLVPQVINEESPVIFLSVSKDGGQTYGYNTKAPMGAIGERTFRSVWRKLGTTPRGQGFTPKIEFFNDTPFVVLGAAWDFEILPE